MVECRVRPAVWLDSNAAAVNCHQDPYASKLSANCKCWQLRSFLFADGSI